MVMTSMSISVPNWDIMDELRHNKGRGATMNDVLTDLLVKCGYIRRDGIKIEIKKKPAEEFMKE